MTLLLHVAVAVESAPGVQGLGLGLVIHGDGLFVASVWCQRHAGAHRTMQVDVVGGGRGDVVGRCWSGRVEMWCLGDLGGGSGGRAEGKS